MAKEIPYFKFYTAEWANGDITLEDYECQGVFINVCAYYWSKDCELKLTVLIKRFRGFERQINTLIESGIIKNINGSVSISFLNEQMQSKEVQKITNQKNGAKGGRPKKEETEIKPTGLFPETQTKANVNPNKTNIEERKEEERKKDIVKTATFFTLKNFDDLDLEDGTFMMIACRDSKKSIDEVKSFKKDFIEYQKGMGTTFWKNEKDAKLHYVNWLKKQNTVITSSGFVAPAGTSNFQQ